MKNVIAIAILCVHFLNEGEAVVSNNKYQTRDENTKIVVQGRHKLREHSLPLNKDSKNKVVKENTKKFRNTHSQDIAKLEDDIRGLEQSSLDKSSLGRSAVKVKTRQILEGTENEEQSTGTPQTVEPGQDGNEDEATENSVLPGETQDPDGSIMESGEKSGAGVKRSKKLEVADELSTLLCNTLIKQEFIPFAHNHAQQNDSVGMPSYLWIPIRQRVPGFSSGIVLDTPVFATGCFKWRLRKCGGEEVWPLVKPCTFWAPMPIQTEECGYSTGPKKYKHVIGRPKEMQPGHCMCDWPCIPYFDPFQKCRVPITEIIEDNDLLRRYMKVSHNHALQLCSAVAQFQQSSYPTRIPWIPLRITNVLHEEQTPTPCTSWEYNPCREDNKAECGQWTQSKAADDCLKDEVVPKEDEDTPSGRRKTLNRVSRLNGEHHGGCMCDWPCLPFFDPINVCRDVSGKVMLDENGENYLPSKMYLNGKDEGIFQCTRIDEDITCAAITDESNNKEPSG